MATTLESVFNHLVLPPKLPGQQDADIKNIERSIRTRLVHACNTLGDLSGQEFQESWHSVRKQLLTGLDLNDESFDKASLLDAFTKVPAECPLVLHISEQNAAIFMRLGARQVPTSVAGTRTNLLTRLQETVITVMRASSSRALKHLHLRNMSSQPRALFSGTFQEERRGFQSPNSPTRLSWRV